MAPRSSTSSTQTQLLGSELDQRATFCHNVDVVSRKCASRLNIIEILSHSSWRRKRTLFNIYRALIGSLIDGCAFHHSTRQKPHFPSCKPSRFQQSVQYSDSRETRQLPISTPSLDSALSAAVFVSPPSLIRSHPPQHANHQPNRPVPGLIQQYHHQDYTLHTTVHIPRRYYVTLSITQHTQSCYIQIPINIRKKYTHTTIVFDNPFFTISIFQKTFFIH